MTRLRFYDITLADREEYLSYPCDGPNSKFSFAQGYMWKQTYRLQFCRDIPDAMLFLSQQEGQSPQFVSPLLKPDADIKVCMEAMRAYAEENGFTFRMGYVCPTVKERIEAECPQEYRFTLRREDSEYVYRTQALSTLAGKQLHQKRNHVNAFMRKYHYTFRPYRKEDFEACMALQCSWAAEKDADDSAAETEAIRLALSHYDELKLRAGVIELDGAIRAFSIGEKIADFAVILIEKADISYNGLFQVINRDTVANLFSDTVLINRCEDMGIEGLRKAKLSYHPFLLLDKYECSALER